jgi:tetratricopeptide (TPR) repeat protein
MLATIRDMLNKDGWCIISGAHGVGKSSLAAKYAISYHTSNKANPKLDDGISTVRARINKNKGVHQGIIKRSFILNANNLNFWHEIYDFLLLFDPKIVHGSMDKMREVMFAFLDQFEHEILIVLDGVDDYSILKEWRTNKPRNLSVIVTMNTEVLESQSAEHRDPNHEIYLPPLPEHNTRQLTKGSAKQCNYSTMKSRLSANVPEDIEHILNHYLTTEAREILYYLCYLDSSFILMVTVNRILPLIAKQLNKANKERKISYESLASCINQMCASCFLSLNTIVSNQRYYTYYTMSPILQLKIIEWLQANNMRSKYLYPLFDVLEGMLLVDPCIISPCYLIGSIEKVINHMEEYKIINEFYAPSMARLAFQIALHFNRFEHDNTKALKYFQIAAKYCIYDMQLKILIYDNMSAAYCASSNMKEAILYHEKALLTFDQFSKHNHHPDLALLHNNTGYTYLKMQNFTNALYHFGTSLNIMSVNGFNDLPSIITSLCNTAYVFEKGMEGIYTLKITSLLYQAFCWSEIKSREADTIEYAYIVRRLQHYLPNVVL